MYNRLKKWAASKQGQKEQNIILIFLILNVVIIGSILYRTQLGLIASIAEQKAQSYAQVFKWSSDTPLPTLIPPITPTVTPIIWVTVTPTSIQTYQSTQVNIPNNTNNSDPIVHCNLYECGVVDMPKSQCSISGCCIVGNQNFVTTDHNKCIQMQQNNNQSTNTQQNQPSLQQTTQPNTPNIQNIPNNQQQTPQQNNNNQQAAQQNQTNFNECMKNAQAQYQADINSSTSYSDMVYKQFALNFANAQRYCYMLYGL